MSLSVGKERRLLKNVLREAFAMRKTYFASRDIARRFDTALRDLPEMYAELITGDVHNTTGAWIPRKVKCA